MSNEPKKIMTPSFKVLIGSAIVCVAGSFLVHYDFDIPGYTTIIIGVIGLTLGPMAIDLD